jgi:chromosome segregation ATPase
MNEAIPAVVVALIAAVGALIRERQFRRERASHMTADTRKLDAEAEVSKATAVDTISATVLGLLTVMEKKLGEAEHDLEVAQTALRELREDFDEVRRELESEQGRNADLEDQIENLTRRLIEAGQQENP